jgi:hypothetical protein
MAYSNFLNHLYSIRPIGQFKRVTELYDFQMRLFTGNVFKELTKALLEKSQYLAIPYGYENPYSNVKKMLPKNLEDCSETAIRIRTSPDLLVFDEEHNDV